MKSGNLLKPHFPQRSFGSEYDPVLSGVAHGLDRLFPPIVDEAGETEAEAVSGRQAARGDGGVGDSFEA